MLLHGSYMSIEKNESPDGRCLYRPKSSLKRYFHLTCLPKRMWSCWRTASLLPPVACLFVLQQLQLKSKPINDFLNSIHLALSYWTPVPWKTCSSSFNQKKKKRKLVFFGCLCSQFCCLMVTTSDVHLNFRYWNINLWNTFFTKLLNLTSDDNSVMVLKSVRKSFEDYMCSSPQLIKKLKMLLVKQRDSLCSA